MPKQTYRRWWCKKCKEWTLFNSFSSKCNECDSPAEDYMLSEIPREKILEQRERYSKKQREYFKNLPSKLLTPSNPFLDLFKEDWEVGIEVIEDDAGQKDLDNLKQKETMKQIEEERAERAKLRELSLQYKGLSRNDICLCGSGKKYKKCCESKFN
jgi:hypothetical protein